MGAFWALKYAAFSFFFRASISSGVSGIKIEASAAWSDYDQSGATLPPLLGGPSWSRHPEPLDLARITRLLDGLNLKDWLPLRGLGALLRADMLWQRREFAESADSDEAGHAFQSEAGHLFRREAGRCSDLKPATLGVVPLGQVG